MNDYELIPTRASLLSRLKDWGDAASWQDFFDTYWRLIYRVSRKAGLTDDEAQDVVQETLLNICQHIREFQYDRKRGSFKGWLLTTTSWRIRDRLRKRRREKLESLDADEHKAQVFGLQDREDSGFAAAWDAEWENNLTDAALERVKKQIAPKHFQIFDLAMMRNWPTAKIAKTLSVSSGYVYLIKHRVSARLRREVKKLRAEPCQIPNSALGSRPEAKTS